MSFDSKVPINDAELYIIAFWQPQSFIKLYIKLEIKLFKQFNKNKIYKLCSGIKQAVNSTEKITQQDWMIPENKNQANEIIVALKSKEHVD